VRKSDQREWLANSMFDFWVATATE